MNRDGFYLFDGGEFRRKTAFGGVIDARQCDPGDVSRLKLE